MKNRQWILENVLNNKLSMLPLSNFYTVTKTYDSIKLLKYEE